MGTTAVSLLSSGSSLVGNFDWIVGALNDKSIGKARVKVDRNILPTERDNAHPDFVFEIREACCSSLLSCD